MFRQRGEPAALFYHGSGRAPRALAKRSRDPKRIVASRSPLAVWKRRFGLHATSESMSTTVHHPLSPTQRPTDQRNGVLQFDHGAVSIPVENSLPQVVRLVDKSSLCCLGRMRKSILRSTGELV